MCVDMWVVISTDMCKDKSAVAICAIEMCHDMCPDTWYIHCCTRHVFRDVYILLLLEKPATIER